MRQMVGGTQTNPFFPPPYSHPKQKQQPQASKVHSGSRSGAAIGSQKEKAEQVVGAAELNPSPPDRQKAVPAA
jgi:hypothetical protein